MQKCIELNEKLKDMDRDMTVNPQYVQRVCKLMNSCIIYANNIEQVLTLAFKYKKQ